VQKQRRRHLTTVDVARLFEVSITTAARWFDTGLLTGSRLPPMNGKAGYRRATVSSAIALANRLGRADVVCALQQSATEGNGSQHPGDFFFRNILHVAPESVSVLSLADAGYLITFAADCLAALAALSRSCHTFAIIDAGIGKQEARLIVDWLRRYQPETRFAVLVCEDGSLDDWRDVPSWKKPVEISRVIAQLEKAE